MTKILLVSPGEESSQKTQASWLLHSNALIKKKAFTSPLHIATIAALTPAGIEVDLWDEPVQGLINENTEFSKEYDLVGITGYGLHFPRAKTISKVFRDRGVPVAVGGPGVSSFPEMYRRHFDIIFIGEAELTWAEFISDFLAGDYKTEYKAETLPDLSLSPAPRWDSIAEYINSSYLTASVQVTRGCPFNCEFCDVWQLFGRKMRVKPIEKVIKEITRLEELGVDTILLCSDNFHGSPRYAKDLVKALIPLNESFKQPMQYRTEITITVARDNELLELMADACFSGFLVGIESPDPESLNETRKNHNLRFGDLTENCLKVLSYGVPIDGSMIVGFDNDTVDIFDRQVEFLQEACIPFPRPHMLKAIHGTDLWKRLKNEGRVVEFDELYGNTMGIDPQHTTNIIPKKMTRREMLSGYLGMIEKIWDWDNFEVRIKGFVSNIKRQPKMRVTELSFVNGLKSALPGMEEKARNAIQNVFEHTETTAPFMILPVAILAMRHYQEVIKLPHTRESLLKQIEIEEKFDVVERLAA